MRLWRFHLMQQRLEDERLLRVERHWLMVFAYRAYAEYNEGTFYAGG